MDEEKIESQEIKINDEKLIENKGKTYKENNTQINKIFPGDSSELPDDFFRVVVFIDNAYFLRLKKYFFKTGLKFSTANFIKVIAKKNNLFVEKIFLYDAPPFQNKQSIFNERRMREIYDKFVFRFREEGIVVREGRTQRLKVDGTFRYFQKGVDMLLGIDAVSILNDFPGLRKIVLLTGDSDFVPVVEKLNEIGIETVLFTYFNRNRNSSFSKCNELVKSVSEYIKLTKEDFLEVAYE